MRSANYLVVKPNGEAFISEVKLEHNMQFGKEEGVKWLSDKHNAHSVTYITRAQIKSIQDEIDNS